MKGMEDPDPHAPQFSTSAPPNADWIKAQSPYEPPFGKWVRAPPPYAFLHASLGLPPLPYDRSPPLMMTPPLSMPQHASQTMAPPPNAPLKFPRGRRRDTYDEPFETIDTRRIQACLFKKFKLHPCLQNNNSVTKTCIRESAIYDLPDESVGITWVGVRGMDSTCLVTRNKDLENLEHKVLLREKNLGADEFLQSFWNVIFSEVEVEDFEGRFGESCQMFNDSSVKPFGVVCVVSGNNEVEKSSGHEASSAEFDPGKAIKLLQDEMKSDSAFTFDKTVLTAISAFQHLFLEMFEEDEMRVFAWKKDDIIGEELQQERKDADVEELLASLNGPDRSPIWSSRRKVSRSPVRRAPPKRSPSCIPVRAPSRTTRRSYSRSHRYGSLSRSPSAEGSPKLIRRGRVFSDRFSYPQRFRSPSPDRSPLRSYRYSGRSDRDRYSSFRRSPRRYRSPIRDRTPPRYRSRRSRTRSRSLTHSPIHPCRRHSRSLSPVESNVGSPSDNPQQLSDYQIQMAQVSSLQSSVVTCEIEISVFYSLALTGTRGEIIDTIRTVSGADIRIENRHKPAYVTYVLVGSSGAVNSANDLIKALVSATNHGYASNCYIPFPSGYDPYASYGSFALPRVGLVSQKKRVRRGL